MRFFKTLLFIGLATIFCSSAMADQHQGSSNNTMNTGSTSMGNMTTGSAKTTNDTGKAGNSSATTTNTGSGATSTSVTNTGSSGTSSGITSTGANTDSTGASNGTTNTGASSTSSGAAATLPSLPSSVSQQAQPQSQTGASASTIINTAQVAALAKTVAQSAFNYNYQNYQQNFKSMSGYFTKDAWQKFQQALKSSQNLTAVSSQKLTVVGSVTGQAEVSNQSQQGGVNTWDVQFPMTVVYTNPQNNSIKQNLIVKVVVVSSPSSTNQSGIAVNQFIAQPDTSAATSTTSQTNQ